MMLHLVKFRITYISNELMGFTFNPILFLITWNVVLLDTHVWMDALFCFLGLFFNKQYEFCLPSWAFERLSKENVLLGRVWTCIPLCALEHVWTSYLARWVDTINTFFVRKNKKTGYLLRHVSTGVTFEVIKNNKCK